MRRSALFLAFAVALASFVGLLTPAAQAAATLSAATTTPFVGQETIMTANSGTAVVRPIVLEAKSGSSWVVMRSANTEADGTAKFQIGTSSATRDYRAVAKAVTGFPAVTSNTVTLKTKSVEGGDKTATIKATPKKPYVYQPFTFTGTTGTPNRYILLQGKSGSTWTNSRSATTDAGGKYTFTISSAYEARDFRVLVPSFHLDGPVLSPPTTLETKKNTIGLVVSRVGGSSKIVADGFMSAKQPGRVIRLQKATNVWTTIATEQQDANQHVRFDNVTLSKSQNYRLLADVSTEGAPSIISNMSSLTYGPSAFGARVMYITTRNGGTPTKRGVDYAGTTVMNGLTASLETVAVRGNSSADYSKQGYKVKFDDNIKPFGALPQGKTFNLLPGLQDHSLLRSAVSFTTAQKLSGLKWTPHRVFTELYLNGKYRGSYELVESIKIEPGDDNTDPRVAINTETGVIMEFDHKSESALFSSKLSKSGNYIKFKDPDERLILPGENYYEGITGDKVQKMRARLSNFESVLYGSNSYAEWDKYIDMNSAIDFYLYSEFIKNWDGDFFASVFVYTNDYRNSGSKLVLSPVWDPDRTAGAKTSGTSNVTSPQGWWMNGQGGGHLNQSGDVHTKHWLVRMAKNSTFQAKLRQRWDVVQGAFASAGYSTTDALYSELTRTAANNDRALWQGYNPLGRYGPRASSYDGELNYLRTWYRARYNWMNGQLE